MRYSQVRDKIKSGDFIVWQKAGVFSWLCGGSTHVSTILRLDDEWAIFKDRVAVVEANFLDGRLVLDFLSEKLFKHHGEALWLQSAMTEAQRHALEGNALKRVAEKLKYDTVGLLQKAIDLIANGSKKVVHSVIHPTKIFCSGDALMEGVLVGYFEPLPNNAAPTPEEFKAIAVKRSGIPPVEIKW